ncbi:hypothetical protein [Herbaspirillum rhizosphaerae]|uniref:hypothetical protein n=1 Tax=Herbaspirillum rhizosphaerae TaxID=346179 RepID=UPI00067D1051|nr:hypothetical protein [Herbaspirillum rhizosphaerae]
MKKLLPLLSTLAGVLLIPHAALAAAPEKSLCAAGETPLFQCTIKGKQVSLCASGGGKDDAGKLQYRFGTAQKIELSYPATPQPADGKFFKSETGYSGGGEERIRFKNGDYDYFLFERTVRTGFGNGPNNPEFSAGIITRHGKSVTTRLCSQDGAMKPASRTLPEEEFEYLDN